MKKAKLVVSIIGVIIGGITFYESNIWSMLEDLEGAGAVDSGSGLLMGIMMIAAGIVGICTRNNSRWLCLLIAIIYSLAGKCGMDVASIYPGIEVWSGLSFILAVAYVIMFYIEISAPKDTTPRL